MTDLKVSSVTFRKSGETYEKIVARIEIASRREDFSRTPQSRTQNHAMDKLLKELNKLGVTKQTVTGIIRKPDALLYDSLTNRFVAIGWRHNTAVIYEKTDGAIIVVTVIYSSELKEMVNRRRWGGRWI